MPNNSFFDLQKYPELFHDCSEIYEDSFPEWEREELQNIQKNIHIGTYKMMALLQNKEVIGFYILDINQALKYTLLSFLAIKENKRGMGWGTKLCQHAITHFTNELSCKFLLIEAQERQAKLYAKLGFSTLDLDYQVPSFDSAASIRMQLMKLNENTDIDKKELTSIIQDIFQRGYSLNEDDARIKKQLLKIK